VSTPGKSLQAQPYQGKMHQRCHVASAFSQRSDVLVTRVCTDGRSVQRVVSELIDCLHVLGTHILSLCGTALPVRSIRHHVLLRTSKSAEVPRPEVGPVCNRSCGCTSLHDECRWHCMSHDHRTNRLVGLAVGCVQKATLRLGFFLFFSVRVLGCLPRFSV